MWLAEGAQNRVYLLGSVHLLRESDHPLPTVIDAAYEDAESIVMEIDMDDIDPFAMQGLVNELGLLPGDESLSDIMGNEMYAEAYEAAEELDIPLDMLARSEPWLAAITVEEMLLMRLGFNPMLGVEMHLTSRAIRDGKPVDGFETIEEQLRFMDELSIAAQNELLLQTLRESADLQSIMDDVINAWRRGDTAFLEETLLADMQQYEELNRTLVVDRNHRWMKTIRELLTLDDDYLIVVGALHMVGEDGVPNLLEASGVEIHQMQETLQD
jgi:uncharacterized protein YbaP (TraB family)